MKNMIIILALGGSLLFADSNDTNRSQEKIKIQAEIEKQMEKEKNMQKRKLFIKGKIMT